MRVALIALGVFVAICAIGATLGIVTSCLGGDSPESAVEWLVVVGLLLVLWLLGGGLLYVARRLALRERRRQLATEQARASDEAAVFECPQCQDTSLVRGPWPARWHGIGQVYVARCLSCGWRGPCPEDMWGQLPESALGDPYQRLDDIRDHMLRDRMTRGQIVVCLAGLFAAFVAVFYLVEVPDGDWLAVPVWAGIVGGAWWVGRWLFPPVRKPGIRCVRCGYDLRWLTASRCPECGTEFDSKLLPSQSHGVSGDGKHDESSLG